MKIFAIADLHLALNDKLEKPMDVFGEKWEDHALKLKNIWEELVSDEDIVLIGGDISWAMTLEEAKDDLSFLDSLKGKKILLKGNHDLWWQSLKKLNSIYMESSLVFMQNSTYIVNGKKKVAISGTRGWLCEGADSFQEHDKKIYEREVGRLKLSLERAKKEKPDEIIAFMHYPPTNEKHQPSKFTKLLEEYGVSSCYYGHLHTKEGFQRGIKGNLNGVNYSLISLDYLDVTPKLLMEV